MKNVNTISLREEDRLLTYAIDHVYPLRDLLNPPALRA